MKYRLVTSCSECSHYDVFNEKRELSLCTLNDVVIEIYEAHFITCDDFKHLRVKCFESAKERIGIIKNATT